MKRKKSSGGIFIDVVVLIVCIAIATTCLASGVFAKFTSMASDSDKARVAAFNVTASLDNTSAEVDLSANQNSGTYTVSIKNSAETAVSYNVALTFNENVENIIKSASIKGPAGNTLSGTLDSTGKVFTWQNVGMLAAAANTSVELELVIEDSYSGDFNSDFSLNITFTQID